MKRCTEFVSYNENGYLVKLPKRGDLGLCKNWRGIMLLSVPSKVFCWIILERLKHALDRKLRCEQAGFRKDKSCADHIAALRIIIEQSTEWQTHYAWTLSTSKKLSIVLTGTSSGKSWVTMESTKIYQTDPGALWSRVLSSYPQREAFRAIWNEHGSPTSLLAVINDLHNGCWLDYERGRESGKNRYTMDTCNSTPWPGLCRWHMSSIPESATYANQDRAPYISCRENRPQDQQRKDQSYES